MLFTSKDLDTKSHTQANAMTTAGKSVSMALLKADEMAKAVEQLQPGETCHWASKGAWSMHELVEAMLKKAGPSELWLSTWTITEDPVRSLFLLKEQGFITQLHCLLDYRIKERKPAPLQLLQGFADRVALAQCHAKCAVVQGANIALCYVGSANMSRNPRREAGFVSADTNTALFHLEWLKSDIYGND